MIHFDLPKQKSSIIKVLGVGGGGSNAVNFMFEQNIEGVDFIICNTDAQALNSSPVPYKIQLGPHLTQGLGAGASPQVGKEATEESLEEIRRILEMNTKMAFITAGMGGGTGTGGAPTVARICKDLGILTVGIVTTPFQFEGPKRMSYADEGINELAKHVDSLITIPNDKLLKVLGKGTSLLDAFKAANNVLLGAVQGIAELITRPGLINVDFADVRTVMSEMGTAMMGTGRATGLDRAEEAAEQAISSPLLEDIDLSGAKGILVNITAGLDLTIEEFEIVGNAVKAFASENATVVVGAVIDPEMSDELRVTVVATGIGAERRQDISLPHGNHRPELVRGAYHNAPAAFSHGGSVYGHAGNTAREMREVQPAMAVVEAPQSKPQADNKANIDIFDIPAFLRKQAD